MNLSNKKKHCDNSNVIVIQMARKKRFKYPKRYYLGQQRKEDFIPFEPVVSKEGANSSLHLPVSIPF